MLNEKILKNSISSNTIKKGDKVRVINAITYAGYPFKMYQKEYDVIIIYKDKVIIGIGNMAIAVVNIKNIEKIK